MDMEDDTTDWICNGDNTPAMGLREVDISEIPHHVFDNFTKLTRKECRGNLMAENALSYDDAWLIQCPKSVPLKSIIQDKKLNLNGKPNDVLTAISREDQNQEEHYETMVNKFPESQNMFILLPSMEGGFKMTSIKTKGTITVRRHVQDVPCNEIIIPKKKKHKLPKGIKERHPVYGVDFSSAISEKKITRSRKPKEFYESMARNDQNDCEEVITFKRKKKHKHKSEHKEYTTISSNGDLPCIEEDVVILDNEPEVPRKRKKSTRSKF